MSVILKIHILELFFFLITFLSEYLNSCKDKTVFRLSHDLRPIESKFYNRGLIRVLKVVPSMPKSGAVSGPLEVDAAGEAADHLAAVAAALLLGSTSPQCSSAAAPASA